MANKICDTTGLEFENDSSKSQLPEYKYISYLRTDLLKRYSLVLDNGQALKTKSDHKSRPLSSLERI